MNKVTQLIGLAVTLITLALTPARAQPWTPPGQAPNYQELYNFFYGQLPGTGAATQMQATELAAQASRGGAAALAEAQRSYNFFYGQLPGTGAETKLKAAELATNSVAHHWCPPPSHSGPVANFNALYSSARM